MKKLHIFVVSDSVGETGELTVRAVVSQFRPNFDNVVIQRFPHVKSMDSIDKIVNMAKKQKAVIIYTLVEREMRNKLYSTSVENQISAIDLLGPMMELIERSLNEQPLERPGIVHRLDEDYFKKIEAIEFAVKYDDGRDPRGIKLADIVLVGVSRTSKTPLSQYLAHKSLKVANVPLVPEIVPPSELYSVDPKKCFGLVISPDKLNNIRKERLKTLGLSDDAIYAQHSRIEQEIEHFYKIINKIGCEVIDVTNKAVEETANVILEKIQSNH